MEAEASDMVTSPSVLGSAFALEMAASFFDCFLFCAAFMGKKLSGRIFTVPVAPEAVAEDIMAAIQRRVSLNIARRIISKHKTMKTS